MESILTSIKKLLGPSAEYEYFDNDIVMHINSVLMILTQMGVGPSEGFFIKDATTIWTDFVSDINKIEAIKTYVYMKVKLIFDPPPTSAVLESNNRIINELEWRINNMAETMKEENQNDE